MLKFLIFRFKFLIGNRRFFMFCIFWFTNQCSAAVSLTAFPGLGLPTLVMSSLPPSWSKKVSDFFNFFIEIKFRWKKNIRIFEKFTKKISIDSLIFLIFYRNKVQVKKIYPIFENLRKTFFIGKKSAFKFKKREKKKKMLFSKICEKRFLSEKNPTSSFKIGGFCDQKRFFKLAEISLIISLK